jgi:hypothetical protein
LVDGCGGGARGGDSWISWLDDVAAAAVADARPPSRKVLLSSRAGLLQWVLCPVAVSRSPGSPGQQSPPADGLP